ncbi:hypothetical protein BIW11_03290 [Tropilaelaps mercedesae]|uniref:Uncharacterized protein n=1 Tax=Tropilaelaps mercedesae TaxID=418985 RepID=A0A1V9XP09_9ACAR|nr:hypothetical protein BIW11_03290 [Tropilaelaps mercedesae]
MSRNTRPSLRRSLFARADWRKETTAETTPTAAAALAEGKTEIRLRNSSSDHHYFACAATVRYVFLALCDVLSRRPVATRAPEKSPGPCHRKRPQTTTTTNSVGPSMEKKRRFFLATPLCHGVPPSMMSLFAVINILLYLCVWAVFTYSAFIS